MEMNEKKKTRGVAPPSPITTTNAIYRVRMKALVKRRERGVGGGAKGGKCYVNFFLCSSSSTPMNQLLIQTNESDN